MGGVFKEVPGGVFVGLCMWGVWGYFYGCLWWCLWSSF